MRITLLLGVLVFGTGAIDAFSQGQWLIGIPQAIGAIANLLGVYFQKRLTPAFDAFLLFTNYIVYMLTSIQAFASGSQYLPYAWFVAGIASLVAGAFVFTKFLQTQRRA
ncbi:MAG: hypothetical protein AAGH79_04760 [Bacteroidota bacterium]